MFKTEYLYFGRGNAKLNSKSILTFSLPAGYSCPAAKKCLSKFNVQTNKIVDGKYTEFRCFAASMEMRPAVRNVRWHNYMLLKSMSNSIDRMANLIAQSLSNKLFDAVRLHVSGDFFNEKYFLAWKKVAKLYPNIIFYGYSKRCDLLVKYGQVDENFRITSSWGGKYDSLITANNLICAKVVYSYQQAKDENLPIDHDDSLAIACNNNFALLLHGIQPASSDASYFKQKLALSGWTGYGVKNAYHYS